MNQTYRSKGRGDVYLGKDALVIETGDACIAINRRTRQQVRLNLSAYRLMAAICHDPGSGTARELALRMPRFVSGAHTAGILAHDELPGGRVCVLRTSVHRVFVELTSARAFAVGLLSNGSRPQSDVLTNVDMVQISIDGPPQVHDAVRGRRGAFDRAVATVRRLQDVGVPVGIQVTCTEETGSYLQETLRLIMGLAVQQVRVVVVDKIP